MGRKPKSDSRTPSPHSHSSWFERLRNRITGIHGGGGGGASEVHLTRGKEEADDSTPPKNTIQTVGNANVNPNHNNDIFRDVQKSAYEKAYSKLTPEQRRYIDNRKSTNTNELFASIHRANVDHRNKSRTRHRIERSAPTLDIVRKVTNFGKIFSSLDPTGAAPVVCDLTCLGLSALIQIAEHSKELDIQIRQFTELTPLLCQCDLFIQSPKAPGHIHDGLVHCYFQMFQFICKIFETLEDDHFVRSLRKNHDAIVEAVEEFLRLWKHLLQGIGIEGSLGVLRTEKLVSKQQIRDLLGGDRQAELLFQPEDRAMGSCKWVNEIPEFRIWHESGSQGSNLITMFGDKGCGKMMVTAYVAELLQSEGSIVCSYFCANDGERNNPTNLYRSGISQLLSADDSLYEEYQKLLDGNTTMDWPKQTWTTKKLRSHLSALIGAAEKPVYLVFDSLDELGIEALGELQGFLAEVSKLRGQCKIFMSSRHSNDVKYFVSGEAFNMTLSDKEAYFIAKHLVETKFFNPSRCPLMKEEDRERLAEEAAARAGGSALWVYTILTYLDSLTYSFPIPSIDRLLEVMEEGLCTESRVPEIWAKLRKQVLKREGGSQTLDHCLEIVAFSSRPITIMELVYSVMLSSANKDKTLPELRLEDLKILVHKYRPFFITNEEPNSIVRLAHRSLEELVVQSDPCSWDEQDWTETGNEIEQRQARIHAELTMKCLNYIRHPDFSKETPVCERRRAEFFNYAASSWLYHLERSSNMTDQHLDCFISICKPDSPLLQNWTNEYRRPLNVDNEAGFLPDVSELDALVIAVAFKLDYFAETLLERPDIFKSPHFCRVSAERAILTALYTGRISMARRIFVKAGNILHRLRIFIEILRIYNPAPAAWRSQDAEWNALFDEMIPPLLPELVKGGPEALCAAVMYGDCPILRKLIALADRNPELRKALLEDRGRENQYQSVALAARQGDLEKLQLLLSEPGIRAHLEHIGPDGKTAFHAAAEARSLFEPKVVKELQKAWPKGWDLLDDHGRHCRDLLTPDQSEELMWTDETTHSAAGS